jgi:pyruvate/2-oxoglutarate dehydrogenase complex dihydrolipoamide dehydrogenase (E3) component
MAEYDFDIGILGGGSAGLTIAAGTTQLGAKTLLVEKEKELGGDCLHFGCVPRNIFPEKGKKGLRFFFHLRGRACGTDFEGNTKDEG